ncbi:MAG: universal stress protein [bacterium]|nr:universal stress protein [bacterium]
MSKNLYIVPYDFTPVSEKALEYALFLGSKVRAEIKLLNVAPDKAKGMQAKSKLQALVESTQTPPAVELTSTVRVGSIFTDIGSLAKKEHAQLIIMGTHGKRGLQSLFGSHAMKVVTSAECPFLIVQKNTEVKEVKNILVPIDLTKESLQIVNIAGDMSKILKSQVHVLAEDQSDQILHTRLHNRISIVKDQYEERDITPTVEITKKRGSYDRKIMSYAKSNDGGMIAIAYHSESLLPQFDTFAQNLMCNKQGIPFLVVNSKLASSLYF